MIRKPAAAEYENAPGVMLQAHMDMVCEKASGAAHDFETDPIRWQIEGDRINTNGRTTLGADDGIGVALALSVLEDDSLPHPALEVLFTTAEEEDFSGAAGFDTAAMRSKYLINLDHCCDREFLCGSCGGQAAELKVPVESGAVPEGWIACTLTVSGLLGGHSGEDIHRGHGNAISLLVRLFLALEEQGIPFQLGPVAGGSFRLAIPRDASAVVCFPAGAQEKLRSAVEQLKDAFAMELSASGAQLTVSLASAERPAWCAAPDALLTAALLSPDGIYQMNETLTGLVDTSDNMGELFLTEEGLRIVYEIRSARPSLGNYLYQRLCRLDAGRKMHDGSVLSFLVFPAGVPAQVDCERSLSRAVRLRCAISHGPCRAGGRLLFREEAGAGRHLHRPGLLELSFPFGGDEHFLRPQGLPASVQYSGALPVSGRSISQISVISGNQM
jgi:dipeptidase D